MKLHFHKYQGTGNDFVMVDDRSRTFPEERTDLITFLCDRKMGIGSDGVILLRNHSELDFEMVFFNPDGSRSLCGNGSRCAVAFARYLGMIRDKTTFETTDGVHDAFFENGWIHFSIHDVPGAQQKENDWFINTGSPHYLRLVDRVDELDIVSEGRKIRYRDDFQPGGTNVNFIERLPGKIKVRTYERGVENETLSCGTGVAASALLAGTLGYESPVDVETKGGELAVSFTQADSQGFRQIYLAGPAEKVFEGTIDLPA